VSEARPWTAAGIITLIASWLITNLVLQPFGFVIAYTEWAYETALNGLQTSFTTALGGTGNTVYNSLDGARQSMFDAFSNIAMAGGLASPIVVTILFVTVGTVLGIVTVAVVRYVADYIPGGSYIQ